MEARAAPRPSTLTSAIQNLAPCPVLLENGVSGASALKPVAAVTVAAVVLFALLLPMAGMNALSCIKLSDAILKLVQLTAPLANGLNGARALRHAVLEHTDELVKLSLVPCMEGVNVLPLSMMMIATLSHAWLTALLVSGPLGDRALDHVAVALKHVSAVL